MRTTARLLAFAILAGLAAACAQTPDDAAAGGRVSTVSTSPIHDDADDATASLAVGWTAREGAPGRAAWMADRADVTFNVMRAGAFDAILEASAFQKARRLRVDVDGRPIAPAFVIPAETAAPIVLPIGTLGFGPHLIRFESLDGADMASGKPVSVAVSRLTMERVGG